ncbi:F-box/LRR-repeat protein At3g26922-like [Silene latifolia]|uniref:F-box/LRR-repeat protein At3g26922-like n=1 Tax=Silene latifolia TaxID=37657 RepID=UPI003D76CC66
MESMSKKCRSCENNDGIQDRLSGLPDEVIVHILTLMPTLDAVRAMLLRRFADLWTLVPALNFDFGEYSGRMTRINDERLSNHPMFSSFARFVRNVLMLYRRSTIDTFYLSIKDVEVELVDAKMIGDVQMWLRFAISKQVKDLYFDCDPLHDGLCPPHCVFTSQSLAVLTLSHCTLDNFEHQSQPHMGALTKLSLTRVCGTTNAYDKLLRGCPSLQELFIDVSDAPGLLSLNVNAPSVSKLYLHLFSCRCILNCPSLKIMDIAVYSKSSPLVPLRATDFISLQEVNVKILPRRCSYYLVHSLFGLIENAKVFTLSCEAFKHITSTKKMEFPQNRWKRIVLHPQWDRERCLQVICMLIGSSINLEELIICAGESPGKCELACPKFHTCLLPLLKTVTIHGNHGYEKWCKGQLQVIEFLLRNAVVLDKLVITLGKSKLTTAEELDLIKQVSTFRRASADVTVIFA